VNRSSRSPDQHRARPAPGAVRQSRRPAGAGHARSERSTRTIARSPASRPAVAWPCAPGTLPAWIPRSRAAMTLIPPTSTGAPIHDSLRLSPVSNCRFVTDRGRSTVTRHAISAVLLAERHVTPQPPPRADLDDRWGCRRSVMHADERLARPTIAGFSFCRVCRRTVWVLDARAVPGRCR